MSSGGCRKKKALRSVDQKAVPSVQHRMITSAEYAVMAYVKHMVMAYNSYLTPEQLHTKAHRYVDQHQSPSMFRNLFSLSPAVSESARPHQS